MAGLIGRQPFHAVDVDAVRHDCGDKAGFVLANLAIALDRADLAPRSRGISERAVSRGIRVADMQPLARGLADFERGARISPKLNRAFNDARIERGIVLAQFAHRAGAGDGAADSGDQHVAVERLVTMSSAPAASPSHAPSLSERPLISITGKSASTLIVAHQPGQFDPAHRRHAQFGQQQIGPARGEARRPPRSRWRRRSRDSRPRRSRRAMTARPPLCGSTTGSAVQ